MKIVFIGNDNVGLPIGICFKETGNKVTHLEICIGKVENLSSGHWAKKYSQFAFNPNSVINQTFVMFDFLFQGYLKLLIRLNMRYIF